MMRLARELAEPLSREEHRPGVRARLRRQLHVGQVLRTLHRRLARRMQRKADEDQAAPTLERPKQAAMQDAVQVPDASSSPGSTLFFSGV